MTRGLFEEPESDAVDLSAPLADRMRPRTLDEVVGQEKTLGPGRALRKMIEEDRLRSIILWGPPGTGKTTKPWMCHQTPIDQRSTNHAAVGA